MLDSLVRVSRRVGWVADIAADPVRSLRSLRVATAPRARRRDPPGAHWGQSAPPPRPAATVAAREGGGGGRGRGGGGAVAPWEGRPGPPGTPARPRPRVHLYRSLGPVTKESRRRRRRRPLPRVVPGAGEKLPLDAQDPL